MQHTIESLVFRHMLEEIHPLVRRAFWAEAAQRAHQDVHRLLKDLLDQIIFIVISDGNISKLALYFPPSPRHDGR
jgi:hypothetical protein